MRSAFLLTLLLFLNVFFLHPQETEPTHQFSILTIHGFIEVGQWERSFDNALYAALNSVEGRRYGITRHYFGTEDVDSEERLELAIDNLRFTIERQDFDLAILVLPAIIRVTLPYLDGLLPDIPIIFALPGDTELDAICQRENSYVVKGAAASAIRDTIRSIPTWMPNLRRIIAISGIGMGDAAFFDRARPYLDELSDQYNVEIWQGLPLPELLENVAELDRRTAIMFLTYDKSRDDATYRTIDVVADVCRVSGAPVFSFYDTLLGVGAAGGVMTNAAEYGRTVADIAVEVLEGQTEVSEETEGRTRTMFDDRVLRRYGIQQQNLPPGAEILYREPNLIRDHLGIVLAVLFVIVAQAGALSHMVLNRNRWKRAEAILKESVHEKEVLLKEVHHRVKNNLQVVNSILSMHGRMVHDPAALQGFRDTAIRIQAMGLLHNKLYASGSVDTVFMQEYFQGIADHIVQSYRSPDRIVYQIECGDVYLDVETASPCGLIMTELMTNSIKYAFPDERRGLINVSLTDEETGFTLTYRDDGVGLPDGFDSLSKNHLGFQIVNALVRQLHGTAEIRSEDGVYIAIRFESSARRISG